MRRWLAKRRRWASRLALAALAPSLSCRAEPARVASFSGMVSAATPEAAQVGARILEAGGNAIDAAVAVSFALAVSEPAMSGLGGQTQILFQPPGGEARAINGTSFSPRASDPAASLEDLTGFRATTVPTSVRTLDYLWRRHGSGRLTWSELLAPAIDIAERGFTVGPFRHRVWKLHQADLAESPATRALFLNPDGSAPREGAVWRQPTLAKTLRRLATRGADEFYRGEMAGEIAADMAAHGGWLSRDDLRSLPDPVELPALRGTYREWDVWTLPPPGGGWVLLQALNLLESFGEALLNGNKTERLRGLVESLRIAHRSRREAPVTGLEDYSDEVREKTDKERARELWISERSPGSGETTHFSIVDGRGMAVAVTASVNNYFGAKVAHQGLGFLYNDYMREFVLDDPGHPFALRARGMPFSSMSPTILGRNGSPALVLGSPGSERIISAIALVVHQWVDRGRSIDLAVAAKRFHVTPERALYLESAESRRRHGEALLELGYAFQDLPPELARNGFHPFFGGVHALALENGAWRGAADPRRDGAVVMAGSTNATR